MKKSKSLGTSKIQKGVSMKKNMCYLIEVQQNLPDLPIILNDYNN